MLWGFVYLLVLHPVVPPGVCKMNDLIWPRSWFARWRWHTCIRNQGTTLWRCWRVVTFIDNHPSGVVNFRLRWMLVCYISACTCNIFTGASGLWPSNSIKCNDEHILDGCIILAGIHIIILDTHSDGYVQEGGGGGYMNMWTKASNFGQWGNDGHIRWLSHLFFK